MTAELTSEELATYQWQIWVSDLGEAGQEKLKAATVLISRCGGLGSVVAYELAAAGIGKLIIAHGGNVKPSDLNRQLLMTHDWLGRPRVESAKRRLLELNPRMEIEPVAENVNDSNAARLVASADIIVDCAPLFEERFLMNREAVRQNKPLVECAIYDLEAHIYTVLPGQSACLACLYPARPPAWKREFPVIGAVSGMVACLGAMEAIKLIAGIGTPLVDRMVMADLREMKFRELHLKRRPDCEICGQAGSSSSC